MKALLKSLKSEKEKGYAYSHLNIDIPYLRHSPYLKDMECLSKENSIKIFENKKVHSV
jgi:hypothetical protein